MLFYFLFYMVYVLYTVYYITVFVVLYYIIYCSMLYIILFIFILSWGVSHHVVNGVTLVMITFSGFYARNTLFFNPSSVKSTSSPFIDIDCSLIGVFLNKRISASSNWFIDSSNVVCQSTYSCLI